MEMNPKLDVGDRVVLWGMSEESMSPGSKGTVTSVTTVFNETIYGVDWDDGRKLNLLSDVDYWQKVESSINESSMDDFIMSNLYLKNFDLDFFVEYLKNVRNSGIVNMFTASQYLYIGKDRIEHEFYYKEFDESRQESFDAVLEQANESQSKMIQGVIKILEKEGKDADVDNINRYLRTYSKKLLEFYINILS